ncbi:acyl-CoA thioesterase-1 [Nakamurella panacisegetis]|uniref:Acyl-CoA thioesterase-1 n=1 Tax=Nakamurella panacisegetis TaxID=1090615 RepID=A0A1H0M176_9ACTN|nr:GDSL-type esterase/lipase family protein [Nakamurella panacisegetis]SDO74104.1 acyl-CoA thioesterase-1 [Nakamurella panacisegetis]
MTGAPTVTTTHHGLTAEQYNFLRYTRLENWSAFTRFPVSPSVRADLLAAMCNAEPDVVRAALDAMAAEVDRMAKVLLSDTNFRAAVIGLSGAGETIAVVGDSITADRLGWCELLTATATRIDPASPDRWRNFGVSGDTTANVLERFDLIAAAAPTRVLILLGTNDAREHGRPRSGYRMATASETGRNLAALINLCQADLGARVTLLTPPPGMQERIDATFASAAISWQASAIDELAQVVRDLDPRGVDIHHEMTADGPADLLENDGVHPNVRGQLLIATAVARHLAYAGA